MRSFARPCVLLATLAFASAGAACSSAAESPSSPPAPPAEAEVSAADRDLLADALDALRATCDLQGQVPVPAGAAAEARPAQTALAVYTAHPDDEAMYGGGTLTRLTRDRHRVALVVASHGEGGRLLLPGEDGEILEHRDRPREEVVRIRDGELRAAASQAGLELHWLYPAAANVDDAFTTECTAALVHWDAHLPGGLAGFVARLVHDLRQRAPAVVLTLDTRDDPQGSSHGHHEAVGGLVDLAARLAADPRFGEGKPHTVAELWTFAPKDVQPDLVVPVDPNDRLAMLRAYASQFLPEHLEGFGARPHEHFVLKWRTAPEPVLPAWVSSEPSSGSP